MVRMNLSIVASQFVLVSFRETTPPPAVPGRAKGLSLSVPGEARWYSIPKDAARNGKNPRLQGAGQMMQEAEYSVPLERLAGTMRFQGLRKPQAEPGVLTL